MPNTDAVNGFETSISVYLRAPASVRIAFELTTNRDRHVGQCHFLFKIVHFVSQFGGRRSCIVQKAIILVDSVLEFWKMNAT